MRPKLFDYLAGKISRRTLLGVVFPCMCVNFFGMLALAILLNLAELVLRKGKGLLESLKIGRKGDGHAAPRQPDRAA